MPAWSRQHHLIPRCARDKLVGALFALLLALPLLAQEQDPPIATVVVPVVGSVPGPNAIDWKTDVELINDLGSEATISLMLPTAPDQPVILTTIAPGDRLRFTDVVGQAFGLDIALSPLLVQTLGRRSITVRATVYGVREGKLLPIQPIAVNYGSTYFPLRVLDGLSFSDAFRTNIGLANLGDTPAEFVMALQRLPGRNVAITRIVLPPNSNWHTAAQLVFPLITKGDDFSVVVETSAERTYVYGSVIENETSAARFIQPRVGSSSVATNR